MTANTGFRGISTKGAVTASYFLGKTVEYLFLPPVEYLFLLPSHPGTVY